MKAWLVVLERRGVFIWPLRVVPHVAALLLVGRLVNMLDCNFILAICFSMLLGGLTTTMTIYAHVFGVMILDSLEQAAHQSLEGLKREVRELDAANASDKRGALTMKDES